MIDLATKIRLMRDLLVWKQTRIAEELNVHPNTVSKWEMGVQAPHRKYGRMLVIMAERNGIVFNERGYPEYASKD